MNKAKKRYKRHIKVGTIIAGAILFCVFILSLGYASLSSNLSISAIATLRPKKDIRVTGVEVASTNSSGASSWEDYNVSSFSSGIVLPNSDSTVTYDVEITNIGNVEVGILDITGLPSNLDYSISNYTLKNVLCDDTNSSQCKLGSVTTLHITIGYKNNGYNSSNTSYDFDMMFDFKRAYNITYVGFASNSGLPSKILDGETKTATFTSATAIPVDVVVTNATGSYSSPTLTLSSAVDNVVVTRRFSITYVDFTGSTSGLANRIGPEGGTITFNSTTGIPDAVLVTGASNEYNAASGVLELTNVTDNIVITMTTDGIVEITSVSLHDIHNVTQNSNPQITNNGQGITFDLGVTVNQNNQNDTFYVTYAIVVTNDSVHEQKVLAGNFTPTIVGSGNQPNVTYDITDVNGNSVFNQTIAGKTSETYYVTITIIPQEQGTWGVEGETEVPTAPDGTITGVISGTTQGDLSGTNTITHFVAEITNTFEETKTFQLSIDDNRFKITDSNGNTLSSMTIAANTIDTYDFYIINLNGNSYVSSPVDVNVNVGYDTKSNSIGLVSIAVDIDPNLSDTTPPTISGVTATITNVEKQVSVSWIGTDDNTIDNYYIEIYEGDTAGSETKVGDTIEVAGSTNGTRVTQTVTVPDDNKYYYFKVYGKDHAKNLPSSSDISGCTTSSGVCSRSSSEKYKWNFTIKLILTNANSSRGDLTSNTSNNKTYEFNALYDSNANTTLSGKGGDWGTPSNISSANITYTNGTTATLPSGNSQSTAYSYNNTSGRLNLYHIKGDIQIRASGVNTATCLAEGTKVLMVDFSYKNIEDIGYDDLVAAWDYENGEVTAEYPLWIEQAHEYNIVTRVTFEDNSYIDFVGDHAVYSADANLFVSILDKDNFKVGTKVAKVEKNKLVSLRVISIDTFYKDVKYYFVGTTTYNNLIANDILTADRHLMMSNLYGFDEMGVWPKERNEFLSHEENLLDYAYFKDVLPYYLYKGFRVREAGYLFNSNKVSTTDFGIFIDILNGDHSVVVEPITKDGDRYWMVTTSEDFVNDTNKKKYLRKEGSTYILPKSNNKYFKGWYNTADNTIYQPGDKIEVAHGTYFKAIYSSNNYKSFNEHISQNPYDNYKL